MRWCLARKSEDRATRLKRLPLELVPRSARLWLTHRYREWNEIRHARGCDTMVLSRAKSGRTWLRAMLSRLYQQHYDLAEAQLIEYDNFHAQRAEIPTIYFSHGHYLREPFATPTWQRDFGDKRLVFLARHPCDVAVSEYFQSTKRAGQHKVELLGIDDALSMFDFVMTSQVGLPSIIAYLNSWVPNLERLENVRMLRYEDMRARPVEVLGGLVDFLQAPFSKDEIQEAVDFSDFDNLKKLEGENFFNNSRLRPADPDDPDSFKVRRGKVGGYADYFDDEQIAAMEGLVRSRLSPFFNYESE
jgi:hypothetical protein